MSIQVSFNGSIYTLPRTGDEDWGNYTTLFLASVAQNTLTKSGGTFELTSDMNFGPAYGLTSVYYTTRNASNSSNPASEGLDLTAPNRLRLGVIPDSGTPANAVYDAIAWRNNANNDDLRLLPTAGDEEILNYNGVDLADVSTAQTLTNKSLDADDNTLTNIRNASIAASAAIDYSKLNLAGSIVNNDIATLANIAGTKVSPNFGTQNISTTGTLDAGATTLSGVLNMSSNLINNLATPVASTDAATKAYVDSVAQGLDVKASVRAATTTNISGTYTGSPTFTIAVGGTTLSVDGTSLSNGDRVLVKSQSTQTVNGIYVVSGVGSSVVLTRSTDANSSSELTSAFVFVQAGSTYADTSWVMTADPFTIDVTNCTWSQFSGAGTYTASTGLVLTGTNFAIGTSGSNGVDNSMVNTAAAIARSKLASGTADHVLINDVSGVMSSEAQLAITRGGTGQATANTGFNALAPTTTRGDLIYRNATVNARLSIGAANTVLTSDATDPSWSLILNANIDAAAAIARSKIATGTAGYVVINDGSTGALSEEARLSLSRFATGTSGLPLLGQGASSSTYAQLSLASGVTGTLPIGNGGTGATLSGLTAEDLILGASGSALKRLAVGSNGNLLTISGGAVAWSSFTLSGSNTGDVTLGSFGSVPNGNAASLSGQVLTLQPADSTNPGAVSTTTQAFAGAKTFLSSPAIRDTLAAFDLTLASSSNTNLTANRTLTLNVQNASRTLSMAGNLTVAGTTSVNGTFTGTSSGTNTGDQTITLTGDVTGSGTGSFATTISAGVIVNNMVSASAAIAFSKLAALTSANILVGSAGNVATAVAVTGDIGIDNAGLTSISSGVIVNGDVNAAAAIAGTKVSPDFGSQNIVTTGTLATGTATFTTSATIQGTATGPATQNVFVGDTTANGSIALLKMRGNDNVATQTEQVRIDAYYGSSSSNRLLGRINFQNTVAAVASAGGQFRVQTSNTAGTLLTALIITDAQAVQFANITTTASAANAFLDNANNNNILRSTSSIRYKENVIDLAIDSSRIFDLRPVEYDDKTKKTHHFGLIAEEVHEVLPELVQYTVAAALNPKLKKGTKAGDELVPDGVQYALLGVLLLKEVKELRQRVKSLESRLTA